MGIAERKSKEKHQLRNLILDGAKKLFLEKGMEKTTIRNIADEIEYSVGTVYVYFKNKDEILNGLHSRGFIQLKEKMQPLLNVSDPMERLKALGKVYVIFALENPEMYELMFTMKAPIAFLEKAQKDEWNEGQSTFEILRHTVEECISTGRFDGHEPNALTYLMWGFVHGICSFKINGRIISVKDEHPEDLVYKSYSEFVSIIDKI